MAKIYYQEDCNLVYVRGTKQLLSLVMVVRDMHMH